MKWFNYVKGFGFIAPDEVAMTYLRTSPKSKCTVSAHCTQISE